MIDDKKYFRLRLLKWNSTINHRPMPWKGEKDAYKIWLSEVILQQTRVEQGWDYYNKFVSTFPTVQQLAKAPDTRIFKLWEGLGYYTRCRNLIATARYIAGKRKGRFPNSYEEILSLKGVGPYTAAAIASFAFGLPHAVVDGNVFRVLARYFGIHTPIDSTYGKRSFTILANELLHPKQPGAYNQALMDLGAVVCRPVSPLCESCHLKRRCHAFTTGSAGSLPVKSKGKAKKNRWLYYLVAGHNGKLYVRKRGKKDIWKDLYEFILIESEHELSLAALNKHPEVKSLLGNIPLKRERISPLQSQQLTHQTINGRFIHLSVPLAKVPDGYRAVSEKRLSELPFPRFITRYLAENSL